MPTKINERFFLKNDKKKGVSKEYALSEFSLTNKNRVKKYEYTKYSF